MITIRRDSQTNYLHTVGLTRCVVHNQSPESQVLTGTLKMQDWKMTDRIAGLENESASAFSCYRIRRFQSFIFRASINVEVIKPAQ